MSIHLDRTIATSSGTPVRESEWTRPRQECPHPEWWTAHDIEATEIEVIEGVAGVIRLLQPIYVIETGCHRGFTSEAIGRALLKNGHGCLETIDMERRFVEETRSRCDGLPVRVHHGNSLEFTPAEPIDFAWLDSGPNTVRFEEFLRFEPHMHGRTIVGFHDTGTHHTPIRHAVAKLAAMGFLNPVYFPTPRGVALCQVISR